MVVFWRQAGPSYVRYSQICAQAVRASLKLQYQADAKKAGDATVKVNKSKQ
uniref:ATP synthase subunit epsilon, mitochondrial-like n=1 Tax=Pristiophorus japonicus TaxID=55135 RepID=UPI00398EA35B